MIGVFVIWMVGAIGVGSGGRWAPIVVLAAVVSTVVPLGKAWRSSRGLPLRSAVAWGGIAMGLAAISQWAGAYESAASGRPAMGHWAYLASLAAIAAMISVFNARTPGGGAWALLMTLLVGVFLIPWLEGSGLAGGRSPLDRLRLEAPWNLFYLLLAVAGVTNYLPTRYGAAAVLAGAALAAEWAGLEMTGWPPSRRGCAWMLGPWFLSGAAWAAWSAPRRGISDDRRLWVWFRDHWGVVWALRVQERFNRSAESLGWPVRIDWRGPIGPDGDAHPPWPPEAQATLIMLLRRFAPADRLRHESGATKGDDGNPTAGA